MTTIALTSGAYSARSIIANLQRCVNLYPEANPQETKSPQPVTHYLRPGLRQLAQFGEAKQVRCVYTATNGDLYVVCGSGLYYVNSNWAPLRLAVMADITTQVKMGDNGVAIWVADGTTTGYQIDMITRTVTGITATNASGTNGFEYDGTNYVDFMDSFLVGNRTGTPDWISTASNAIQFDPLSFASKSGLSDIVQGIAVVQRYVWVIGTLASEMWYDAGGTNFPFALVAGPYVEHGTCAQYSITKGLEAVMWLSQDRTGQAVFLRAENYKARRVSNYAIEAEIGLYPDLDLTVGFCFQQLGHTFAVWRFPTADKTWAYDMDTEQWHELASGDSDGVQHQWRVNNATLAYGQVVGGDYANGVLWALDPTTQTDGELPILRRRGFPHLVSELKRVRHKQLLLDIQVGTAGGDPSTPNVQMLYDQETDDFYDIGGQLCADGDGGAILMASLADLSGQHPRQVWLRYSDDRGASWSNPLGQSLGLAGAYKTSLQWQRLGMARDRVYEVFWSTPMVSALQAAYVTVETAVS